jgi:hypothetical protein
MQGVRFWIFRLWFSRHAKCVPMPCIGIACVQENLNQTILDVCQAFLNRHVKRHHDHAPPVMDRECEFNPPIPVRRRPLR